MQSTSSRRWIGSAGLQIENKHDFAEELLQEIIRLSQMLRGNDPDAQMAAAGYFRTYRYLLDAIWPEFKPQIDWLLGRAFGRLN